MTPFAPATVDAAAKLGLALVLGLPLGWARERQSRSAGLRTYPLLSLSVCGFFLVGLRTMGGPSEQADVFFGVLTGIGFVTGGALATSREAGRGMDTAVSLWVTGAIGAGVAHGIPLTSAALAGATTLALRAPPLARRAPDPRRRRHG